MDSVVCHKGTDRTQRVSKWITAFFAAALMCVPVSAQTDWRQVGGPAIDLMLAAPASGPVERVWFSPDGTTLFSRTASGKIFQTTDFQTWKPASDSTVPPRVNGAQAVRLPESGASVVAAVSSRNIYSLGRQLFRSEDDGRTWTNLTAFRSIAVVGTGQHSVVQDGDRLILANDFGVWRSLDGGLSWTGLNEFLPNLAVTRILSTPNGMAGARIQVSRLGAFELPSGASVWTPAHSTELETEAALTARAGSALAAELGGAEITAVGSAGTTVYAGASDGRIWVSFDGHDFNLAYRATGSRVERIFVDPARPQIAIAAQNGAPGSKTPRLLKTTNYGYNYFWDPLDVNLPEAAVHGLAAETASGTLYVATDKGVFWTHTDLLNNSSPSGAWTAISNGLPPGASVADIRLDPAAVQLYAAVDGYGVFSTPAPHRVNNLRVVNAADYSTRAAAPGGLLSVIGGRISGAQGGSLEYPVLAVLGNNSQIQVPFEAVGPTVVLALQTATGRETRNINVQPVSPGILVGSDGTPMLWDADSGMPLNVKNPAHSSGRMQIWATGLGKVEPAWPTGVPAPMENPPVVSANVQAFLDGAPLQVSRASLLPGYTGFYLVEVQLPSITNAGASELYVTADGQQSNRVHVVVDR
jgi:uncharacterized protein (TIGR03437 family)